MILYEGPSLIDGQFIVAIATVGTANRKTGDMIQTWILRADVSPLDAYRSGADESICGNCPHRQNTGGGCYVNIGQAPRSVYAAYARGSYSTPENARKFERALDKGTPIRIGSYGDPMAVPAHIWLDLLEMAGVNAKWTGYTHQWNAPDRPDAINYRGFLMASADSPLDATTAVMQGWRYFRVGAPEVDSLTKEVECPSDTKGVQCKDCGLCTGTMFGKRQSVTNIFINPHGTYKKRAIKRLDSLRVLA